MITYSRVKDAEEELDLVDGVVEPIAVNVTLTYVGPKPATSSVVEPGTAVYPLAETTKP